MSKSLVHKSLELLGYEKNVHQGQKKKKKKKCKNIAYKGMLDLIPTKHRIISKHDKDIGTILGRSNKTTVYETKKHISERQDPTDENVKRLLSFSNNCIKPDMTNKLLQRAVKTRYICKQKKVDKPEQTAFTEEDFKKFEQEYTE